MNVGIILSHSVDRVQLATMQRACQKVIDHEAHTLTGRGCYHIMCYTCNNNTFQVV